MKIKRPIVYILVKGGVVQAVAGTTENLHVEVLDCDGDFADEHEKVWDHIVARKTTKMLF